MELKETSEMIADYIKGCNDIIHKKGHKIAQEYGLTYDQFHILIFLCKKGTPTINEISSKFSRAQNTISEKISRLEEKELVKRVGDPEDRRITRVILTEKGLDLIQTIKRERSTRVIYQALEKMEGQEIENLLINLSKLYKYLREEV
ncbi:MarR family winged helix-turn-helix transcriptional regulator [Tepidimicrobium xylanilyticum]|uniref:DNA-binding transcriptional regulator, MarR family n=1 Tax=Tepidimicrobium xylanilyticum TaxID=1123352 RepID=A0A1H2TSG5_9FIRM|nr:MarR family transcriptional regulator [Tepidimicrobium xylanilyticum]GMG95879.1 MarR family transcriptional regulator [Tepidimicrobium xylanilyticum]SDW46219.1 DNA-binding transcriptional regulator, MarR family [Tepidimicrobium xylanilyticum]